MKKKNLLKMYDNEQASTKKLNTRSSVSEFRSANSYE